MDVNYTLLVTLLLTLIVVACAAADSEVKATPNTGLDLKSPKILGDNINLNEKKDGSNPVTDPNNVNKVKKGEEGSGLQEGLQNNPLDTPNSSKQSGTGDHKTQPGKDSPVIEGAEKKKSSEKTVSKEVAKGESPPAKDSPRGEECELSNRCTDEKNALVACLRVPGNESPELSLLIQNKGKGPLSVTISAPEFVQLENANVQLQVKEDKKVKVSIKNGGTDHFIVLSAGNGNCSLDFKDLIAHNSKKETDFASLPMYNKFLKGIPAIAFIFLVAIVMASAWMCVSFRRRHFANATKYQALDTDLPVSGSVRTEPEVVLESWDESWGDSWDDEEAPKTPSMPVTPSLSSKGLAPRRVVKDGWKD